MTGHQVRTMRLRFLNLETLHSCISPFWIQVIRIGDIVCECHWGECLLIPRTSWGHTLEVVFLCELFSTAVLSSALFSYLSDITATPYHGGHRTKPIWHRFYFSVYLLVCLSQECCYFKSRTSFAFFLVPALIEESHTIGTNIYSVAE